MLEASKAKCSDAHLAAGTVTPDDLAKFLFDESADIIRYVGRRIPAEHRATISVDDIMQDVCIRAIRTLGDFRDPKAKGLAPWIQVIAKRALSDSVKHCKRVKRGRGRHRVNDTGQRSSSYLDLLDKIGCSHRTVSSELAAREAIAGLQIAVARLPKKFREAVILRHLHHHSHAEVAARLKKTVRSVTTLASRGLDMLREEVAPR